MIGTALDSRGILHLPTWAKAVTIATLSLGMLLCTAVIVRFFGRDDSSDWLLLGIGSLQFIVTALVAAIVLLFSQADASIGDLRRRSDHFLRTVLPEALAGISFPGMQSERLTVRFPSGRDLFGYEMVLQDGDVPVLRMWCGLNVHRLIVIYHFRDPAPATGFADRLRDVFRFTFGGAEAVDYNVSYEPLPDDPAIASVWATVSTERHFLTDPHQKLFWAQDIAMMTESVIRTTARNGTIVTPSLDRATGPL